MTLIPLCLVTGFLGSGKTTFLRRVMRRYRARRLAYLVNEFAAFDVDAELVRAECPGVIALPGGSIFCRCLAGEFVRQLTDLPGRFRPPEGPLEGLVIEASGIADPSAVGQLLAEAHLENTYAVASIVTLVDPGTFLKVLHTLPNVEAQVRAADVALVNKTDLYPPEQIAATEAELRRLHPGLKLLRTVRAEADLELFGPATHPAALSPRPSATLAPGPDPRVIWLGVPLEEPVDVERLAADLRGLGKALYRAKGYVLTSAGRQHLDYAGGRLEMTPAASAAPLRLVLILSSQAQPQAEELVRRWTVGATPSYCVLQK